MAKNIQGISIEIGGNTNGLKKALGDVNRQVNSTQRELKEVNKALKLDPKNTELVAQKQKLLSEQVNTTKTKLIALKEAKEKADKDMANGTEINEKQYRELQREIVTTENDMKSYEKQLKDVNTTNSNFSKKIDVATKKLKGFGDKMGKTGQSLSRKITLPVTAGIAALTKGTEETRESLAKLETNAQSAGKSAGFVKKGLVDLSAVSSETDSNVEALSNLLATGFSEQGMTEAVNALSGAVVKFPDTLKIEGLADGLQETLATGKAVGPFAELLERSGVTLDSFNEGLSKAQEEGKAENYILEILAKTGLANVNKEFQKNNKELVNSKKSQQEFQLSCAELGKVLTPAMTKVTEVATKIANIFKKLSPNAQQAVVKVALVTAALGPLLSVGGKVSTGLSHLSDKMKNLPDKMEKVKKASKTLGSGISKIASASKNAGGKIVSLGKDFGKLAVKAGKATLALGKQAVAWSVNTAKVVAHKVATLALTIAEKAQAVAQGALNLVMSMNPIGLVVIAIAAVVAGLVILWKKCEGFRSFVKKSWNVLKATVSKVITFVKNDWKQLALFIVNPFAGAVALLYKHNDKFRNWANNLGNLVKNKFISHWESLKTKTANIWNATKNAMINPIVKAKDKMFEVIEKIKSFFNNLKLKAIKIPKPKLPKISIVGEFSFKKRTVPHIKWNAKGAIFTKPYIFGNQGVGEAGPEAVLPISKLAGIMADTLNKMQIQNNIVVKVEPEQRAYQSSQNNQKQIIGMLDKYLPEYLNALDMQVVLDDGTLVGKLTPKIDNRLGTSFKRKARGGI